MLENNSFWHNFCEKQEAPLGYSVLCSGQDAWGGAVHSV